MSKFYFCSYCTEIEEVSDSMSSMRHCHDDIQTSMLTWFPTKADACRFRDVLRLVAEREIEINPRVAVDEAYRFVGTTQNIRWVQADTIIEYGTRPTGEEPICTEQAGQINNNEPSYAEEGIDGVTLEDIDAWVKREEEWRKNEGEEA